MICSLSSAVIWYIELSCSGDNITVWLVPRYPLHCAGWVNVGHVWNDFSSLPHCWWLEFYDNVLILIFLKVAKSINIVEIEMGSDYNVFEYWRFFSQNFISYYRLDFNLYFSELYYEFCNLRKIESVLEKLVL